MTTLLFEPSPNRVTRGRRRSIPPQMWPKVFELYAQGLGYRRVANALILLKIGTSKSSVERLLKRRPPYQNKREPPVK